jgi:hypothetical protein
MQQQLIRCNKNKPLSSELYNTMVRHPTSAPKVEQGDGLEQLTLPELREKEKGQVRGVEPVGTDRDKRRREL